MLLSYNDTDIMIEKKWSYVPVPTDKEVKALSALLKTQPIITKLLWQRGVQSLSQAQDFFNPCLGHLHDPFLMKDMALAVARIEKAIANKEHICIYGDYDVDGTTSVALLYQGLLEMGAEWLSFYIPDRAKEGYGVSEAGIAHTIEAGVDLLICVDCGTRAVDKLKVAYEYGMDIIICDHHEVGKERPPAMAMLNTKQKECAYPFDGLSACGIVFKLLQGISQKRGDGQKWTHHLDLVALSIAADIVPMVDENRILMYHGLVRINENPSPGIEALKRFRNQESPFSVSDVVFGLAPLINAVGRMEHAIPAVKLLISKDSEQAKGWADVLHQQNRLRKDVDQRITQEAFSMIEAAPLQEAIILYKAGWPKGLVGIVAARCVENYYRPTIILTQEGEQLVGSGRSVQGYNLYESVDHCAALLGRYGGHRQAVGLRMPLKNIDAFTTKWQARVRDTLKEASKVPLQRIDLFISLASLTPKVLYLLGRMAPYGPAYRQPVFATFPIKVLRYHIYEDKHVKIFFSEKEESVVWEGIGFNMASLFLKLYGQTPYLSIAYKVDIDIFRGKKKIALTLKDMKAYEEEDSLARKR